MPEDESNLVERVSAWLSKEGYPLEFSTAAQLRRAGFHVRQGEYVSDSDGGEPREIDVTATLTVQVRDSLLRIYNLVECKWSKDKPWVLFAGAGSMAQSAMITQGVASRTGSALLWARAGDRQLHGLSMFEAPTTPAFGGRQAFGDKNDTFYHALQGVVSKASLLAKSYDRTGEKIDSLLRAAVVVFPVVVVEGVLLEAAYDGDGGQLRLREVPQIRLHWRGAASWRLHATVDIVAASALLEFAQHRYRDSTVLLRQLGLSFEQLHQCWRAGTLEHLEVTDGPRGIIGMPSLLRDMKAAIDQKPKQLSEPG